MGQSVPSCPRVLGLLLPISHACGAKGSGTWQGLQIESSELREYTHGMLGSIADKLGKEFAPFLPHAAEAAFASCSQASRALPLLLCQPSLPAAATRACVSEPYSHAAPRGSAEPPFTGLLPMYL